MATTGSAPATTSTKTPRSPAASFRGRVRTLGEPAPGRLLARVDAPSTPRRPPCQAPPVRTPARLASVSASQVGPASRGSSRRPPQRGISCLIRGPLTQPRCSLAVARAGSVEHAGGNEVVGGARPAARVGSAGLCTARRVRAGSKTLGPARSRRTVSSAHAARGLLGADAVHRGPRHPGLSGVLAIHSSIGTSKRIQGGPR